MASTLGKRKHGDEETASTHSFTLFVSNLPYTATSVDLQTLFSDFAPVKTAFVVTEQGTGVSKGVGYVSFALKEDAESTFDQISKEGIAIAGRSLRVQWADHKTKEKKEKNETEEKPRPRAPHINVPRDPDAVRTIIVSGLPQAIDSKVLWKKMRKVEGAENVMWPVKAEDGSEDSTKAHVLFATPSNALTAIDKLHAHVFKGSLLSVALKKRLDSVAKPTKTPNAGKGPPDAAPNRASRLIVRNLPFNVTEQDIRSVFLPYGPIFSVDLPTSDAPKTEDDKPGGPSSRKGRSKGFGFVWMVSRKDAERALEACNGMTMRAGMAEELVSGKQKKKKQRREEQKLKATGQLQVDGEGEESKQQNERVIAVDWALSKEKWKEERAKIEAEAGDDEGDIEMSGSGSSDEDSDDSGDSDGNDLGVHHGNADSDDDSDSDSASNRSDDEEEPTKPQLPPPETGTTLFIRNVPFTATEDELRTLFRAFGPLRYARLTMDPETERPRGTGFVCFWNKEDADKAVAQSDLLRAETMGTSAPKKNPFSMPSILTPDPSSTLAQTLVLHGRTLDVVRAVTRDVAFKLKEEGQKSREKADKRNLYLLREGVILPNTPAAETLSPAEVERRTSSFNARRALLRSNPSLYISKTRLSIRQIPVFVTERLLKRLTTHAVRAFKNEVKEGLRQNLTEDELTAQTVVEDAADHGIEPPQKGKKQGKEKKPTGVKQAKIVRQQERVDPVTGKGRSKGYGFVEMHTHADALRVLRWSNNNAEAIKLFQEWWQDELKELTKQERAKGKDADEDRIQRLEKEIEKGTPKSGRGALVVEFSIENIQVVHRRAARQNEKPDDTAKAPREKLSLPSKAAQMDPDIQVTKKRRLSDSKATASEPTPMKTESPKSGNKLGSIIGRKRKQRKTKAG